MLLSNVKIKEALEDGRLAIENLDGCAFDNTAINFSLSPIVQVPYQRFPTAVRFGSGKLNEFLEQSSVQHTITKEQPFELTPNKFILASTHQSVRFKTTSDRTPEWRGRPNILP